MSHLDRQAVPEDTPTCVAVRGRTRENTFPVERPTSIGVTVETWGQGLLRDADLPGHVCLFEGEIVVLAVLPEHEGWRSTGTVDAANDEVLEFFVG